MILNKVAPAMAVVANKSNTATNSNNDINTTAQTTATAAAAAAVNASPIPTHPAAAAATTIFRPVFRSFYLSNNLSLGKRIKLSCFASIDSILAIGSNIGSIYIYNRTNNNQLNLIKMFSIDNIPTNSNIVLLAINPQQPSIIAIIAGINSSNNSINQLLYIYDTKLSLLKEQPKLIYKQSNNSNNPIHSIGSIINCLEWNPSGTILYTADNNGIIQLTTYIPANSATVFKQTYSELLVKLDSSIIQLQFVNNNNNQLIISTLTRTYILDSNNNSNNTNNSNNPNNSNKKSPITIGTKTRNGSFGGTINLLSSQYIICSRPGKRLWLADSNSGSVINTLKFTNPNTITQFNNNESTAATAVADSIPLTTAIPANTKDFGLLLPYQSGIISYSKQSNCLYFIDINSVHITDLFTQFNNISSVVIVNNNDIIIMHSESNTTNTAVNSSTSNIDSSDLNHLTVLTSIPINQYMEELLLSKTCDSTVLIKAAVRYRVHDRKILTELRLRIQQQPLPVESNNILATEFEDLISEAERFERLNSSAAAAAAAAVAPNNAVVNNTDKSASTIPAVSHPVTGKLKSIESISNNPNAAAAAAAVSSNATTAPQPIPSPASKTASLNAAAAAKPPINPSRKVVSYSPSSLLRRIKATASNLNINVKSSTPTAESNNNNNITNASPDTSDDHIPVSGKFNAGSGTNTPRASSTPPNTTVNININTALSALPAPILSLASTSTKLNITPNTNNTVISNTTIDNTTKPPTIPTADYSVYSQTSVGPITVPIQNKDGSISLIDNSDNKSANSKPITTTTSNTGTTAGAFFTSLISGVISENENMPPVTLPNNHQSNSNINNSITVNTNTNTNIHSSQSQSQSQSHSSTAFAVANQSFAKATLLPAFAPFAAAIVAPALESPLAIPTANSQSNPIKKRSARKKVAELIEVVKGIPIVIKSTESTPAAENENINPTSVQRSQTGDSTLPAVQARINKPKTKLKRSKRSSVPDNAAAELIKSDESANNIDSINSSPATATVTADQINTINDVIIIESINTVSAETNSIVKSAAGIDNNNHPSLNGLSKLNLNDPIVETPITVESISIPITDTTTGTIESKLLTVSTSIDSSLFTDIDHSSLSHLIELYSKLDSIDYNSLLKPNSDLFPFIQLFQFTSIANNTIQVYMREYYQSMNSEWANKNKSILPKFNINQSQSESNNTELIETQSIDQYLTNWINAFHTVILTIDISNSSNTNIDTNTLTEQQRFKQQLQQFLLILNQNTTVLAVNQLLIQLKYLLTIQLRLKFEFNSSIIELTEYITTYSLLLSIQDIYYYSNYYQSEIIFSIHSLYYSHYQTNNKSTSNSSNNNNFQLILDSINKLIQFKQYSELIQLFKRLNDIPLLLRYSIELLNNIVLLESPTILNQYLLLLIHYYPMINIWIIKLLLLTANKNKNKSILLLDYYYELFNSSNTNNNNNNTAINECKSNSILIQEFIELIFSVSLSLSVSTSSNKYINFLVNEIIPKPIEYHYSADSIAKLSIQSTQYYNILYQLIINHNNNQLSIEYKQSALLLSIKLDSIEYYQICCNYWIASSTVNREQRIELLKLILNQLINNTTNSNNITIELIISSFSFIISNSNLIELLLSNPAYIELLSKLIKNPTEFYSTILYNDELLSNKSQLNNSLLDLIDEKLWNNSNQNKQLQQIRITEIELYTNSNSNNNSNNNILKQFVKSKSNTNTAVSYSDYSLLFDYTGTKSYHEDISHQSNWGIRLNNNNNNSNNNNTMICIICMLPLSNNNSNCLVFQCGHSYHLNCNTEKACIQCFEANFQSIPMGILSNTSTVNNTN